MVLGYEKGCVRVEGCGGVPSTGGCGGGKGLGLVEHRQTCFEIIHRYHTITTIGGVVASVSKKK